MPRQSHSSSEITPPDYQAGTYNRFQKRTSPRGAVGGVARFHFERTGGSYPKIQRQRRTLPKIEPATQSTYGVAHCAFSEFSGAGIEFRYEELRAETRDTGRVDRRHGKCRTVIHD